MVNCHCSRCRRTHGHFAAYTKCDRGALTIAASTLEWYEEDGRARGFCRRCGASVFWEVLGGEGISVAAGTLDGPTGLRTVAQIHVASAGDYYEMPSEGVRYDDGGGALGA